MLIWPFKCVGSFTKMPFTTARNTQSEWVSVCVYVYNQRHKLNGEASTSETLTIFVRIRNSMSARREIEKEQISTWITSPQIGHYTTICMRCECFYQIMGLSFLVRRHCNSKWLTEIQYNVIYYSAYEFESAHLLTHSSSHSFSHSLTDTQFKGIYGSSPAQKWI